MVPAYISLTLNSHLLKQGFCSPLLGAPRISGSSRECSGIVQEGPMQGLLSLPYAVLLVTVSQ